MSYQELDAVSEESTAEVEDENVPSSVLTSNIQADLDLVRDAISASDFNATLHLDPQVFADRVTYDYSDTQTKSVLTNAILEGVTRLNPLTVTSSEVMARLLVDDARKKIERFVRNMPQVAEVIHVEKKLEPSLLEAYLNKAEALRASLLEKLPALTTAINTDIDSLVSVIRGFGAIIPQHAVSALDTNFAKLEKKFNQKSTKDRKKNK